MDIEGSVADPENFATDPDPAIEFHDFFFSQKIYVRFSNDFGRCFAPDPDPGGCKVRDPHTARR